MQSATNTFHSTYSTDEGVQLKSKDGKMIGALSNNRGGVLPKNAKPQFFRVVQGLCGEAGTVSLESVAKPGYFFSLGITAVDLMKFDAKSKDGACLYPRYNKFYKVRIRCALKQLIDNFTEQFSVVNICFPITILLKSILFNKCVKSFKFQGYTVYESFRYPGQFITHVGNSLYLSTANNEKYKENASYKTG